MQVLTLEVTVYAVLVACAAAGVYLLAAAVLGLPGLHRAKVRAMTPVVNTWAALVMLGFPLMALTSKLDRSVWAWLVVATYGGALACSVVWGLCVDRRNRRGASRTARVQPAGQHTA